MGDIVPLDMEELIKMLKTGLGVDIYDYGKIESGGEGYTYLYMENIDEEMEEVLSEIGFEKIKDDLWILDGFEIAPKVIIDAFLPYYKEREQQLWKRIVDIRCKIDEYFKTSSGKTLFNTTFKVLQIVFKWQKKICKSESEFNDFINDLNKLIIEKISREYSEKIKEISDNMEIDFYKGVKNFRNTIVAHDSTKLKELKIAVEYIKNVTGLEYPPRNEWYYLVYQLKILENCLEFLENIYDKKGDVLED